MGRARITLKAIQSARARKVALMQRRKGLMKKLDEFSTMCDADACLIMYNNGVNGEAELVTWPKEPSELHSIIEKYEREKKIKPPKTFDVEDFFENRKNAIEAEISKVHKEILQIKHPTWHPCFNTLGDEKLRDFIATLDSKLEACNQRINMLKNTTQIPVPDENNGGGDFTNEAQVDELEDLPTQFNDLEAEDWVNLNYFLGLSSKPHDSVLHNIPSQNPQQPPPI